MLAQEPDNLVALNMKLKNGLQDCDFDASEKWSKRLLTDNAIDAMLRRRYGIVREP